MSALSSRNAAARTAAAAHHSDVDVESSRRTVILGGNSAGDRAGNSQASTSLAFCIILRVSKLKLALDSPAIGSVYLQFLLLEVPIVSLFLQHVNDDEQHSEHEKKKCGRENFVE